MIKMRFTLGSECCLFIGGLPGSLARYTSAPYPMMREDLPAEGVKETVRNYFPETWIWDLVSLE